MNTIILKDKVSYITQNVKEFTKDKTELVKKTFSKLSLINRDIYEEKSEIDFLTERYEQALEQLTEAEHSFELANAEYIEVAILELQSKRLMLNIILKELKSKKMIE